MPNAITTHYQPFLAEILEKIQTARYQMLKTVSKETVNLYWNIGKMISDKVEQEKWWIMKNQVLEINSLKDALAQANQNAQKLASVVVEGASGIKQLKLVEEKNRGKNSFEDDDK